MDKKVHHGKNIARFRQMLSMKQDVLADKLGDDWTQIKVSRLEGKEVIDAKILADVANALKVPVEAIENFDDEAAISIVANTVNNSDQATGNSVFSYYPSFNPVDKIVEILEQANKEKAKEIGSLRREIEKLKKMKVK